MVYTSTFNFADKILKCSKLKVRGFQENRREESQCVLCINHKTKSRVTGAFGNRRSRVVCLQYEEVEHMIRAED